jgi:hypothetical protein
VHDLPSYSLTFDGVTGFRSVPFSSCLFFSSIAVVTVVAVVLYPAARLLRSLNRISPKLQKAENSARRQYSL